MQEFIHNKIKIIGNLIASYNEVQQLYIQNAFSFEDRFLNLLDICLEHFKMQGYNTQVSEVLNIISMFETAKKGINPYKLEKVSTGRRELKMMIGYNGLEKLYQLISSTYIKELHKLEEAEDILSNLLLTLHQSGFLDNNRINGLETIEKIKDFWNELLKQNESISIINQKLRLKIIPEDIYMLIEKILVRFTL